MSNRAGTPRVLVVTDAFGVATPSQVRAAGRDLELGFALPSGTPPLLRDLYGVMGAVMDLDDLTAVRGFAPEGIAVLADYQVETAAALAATLGVRGTDPAYARRIQDKASQRAVLAAAGLDDTAYEAVEPGGDLVAALAEVGTPAVVKPRRSMGSRFTYRIDDPADLTSVEQAIAESGDQVGGGWIVEELLSGPSSDGLADYVSVEVIATADAVTPLLVASKVPLAPPFREQGGIVPSLLEPGLSGEVGRLAVAAVGALGVLGMAHVEIKLTERGPRVLEVNPRLGGLQETLALLSGAGSLVRIVLDAALGREVPRTPLPTPQAGWWCAPSAPPGASRVLAVDGADDIATWPGVRTALVSEDARTSVDWRRGWGQYAAYFDGQAPDATAARDMVLQIMTTATVRHDGPTDEVR